MQILKSIASFSSYPKMKPGILTALNPQIRPWGLICKISLWVWAYSMGGGLFQTLALPPER